MLVGDKMHEVHQPTYKSVSAHTDLQNKYGQKIINIFDKNIIPNFDFRLAPNVKYSSRDIILATSYIASKNLSAESGVLDLKLKNITTTNKLEALFQSCSDINISSPDTILYQIKKQEFNMFTLAFDRIVRDFILIAKRQGFFKRTVTVAIDYHEDPYYGDKNDKNVIGMKPKLGTSYCFRYASICVVERKKRFTIGVLPIGTFSIKEKVVEQLIRTAKRYVRINKVLLDRAFFTVDVIQVLETHNVPYIMPAVKTPRIKGAINEFYNGTRSRVSDYIITSQNEDTTQVKLIITKSKKKEHKNIHEMYFTIITNIDTSLNILKYRIPYEYRKRWGIETSYKVKHCFKAKTSCKNYIVRYYYFVLSAILYNLWIVFNLLVCRCYGIRNRKMMVITVYVMRSILEEEIIEYYDSKS